MIKQIKHEAPTGLRTRFFAKGDETAIKKDQVLYGYLRADWLRLVDILPGLIKTRYHKKANLSIKTQKRSGVLRIEVIFGTTTGLWIIELQANTNP